MSEPFPAAITVVDSHTEGEPTRVVIDGWPTPPGASMAERREHLLRHQDHLRRAVVAEPRGHEAVVGALLTPPVAAGSLAGVVFFDNEGCLGMCGHGTIGVVRTLAELGRLDAGAVRLDTPVGPVSAVLDADGSVTLRNVPAFCHARDVGVDVPGLGRLTGDVAWGGNWFFLTELPGEQLELANRARLTRATLDIMRALREAGVRGADGALIDHVELFGTPRRPDADSRNFVMCPSGAYDRSPCGTGTSAKLAALHARGALALGQRWRQESVTGGLFTGWLSEEQGRLIPHIRGRAFLTGRTTLVFDPHDPFRAGLPGA
jgi:4-hydroxyproline epimerase